MKIVELNRKFLHLSSLWIPIAINYLSYNSMLIILSTCAVSSALIEILRFYSSIFNRWVNRIFSNILRERERSRQITGATYFIWGSFLTFLFFKSQITIIALLILIFSDTMASIIGIKYGKIKFYGKSLEGSFAFCLTTIMILILAKHFNCLNFSIKKIYILSLILTIVELISQRIKLDDNITIPIVASIIMSYM